MEDDAKGEIETLKELAKVQLDSDWAALPTELLCLVLPHLILHDIKRFHTVCRSWGDTPNPSVQSPVLMYIENNTTRCRFLHPLYKDSYTMYVPELIGAVARLSKDGWLLMSRGKYSIFFFNPFTKTLINLPDLPCMYEFEGITFTSSPTSSDCMVFGISLQFDKYFAIFTICRGEKSWQIQRGENNLRFFISHCNPVFHHGEFYCLGRQGDLGVFDPHKNYWRVLDKPHRQPFDPFLTHEHNFLVECNGELLSVLLGFNGKSISVSKLDSAEMKWHKVKSLGDQMLFVSITSSLSAKRVVQGMENKIYLPRIHPKAPTSGHDRPHCGVFYSLPNGLFQTMGTDFSRKDLCGTGEVFINCCWIKPNADTSYSKEELNWFKDT